MTDNAENSTKGEQEHDLVFLFDVDDTLMDNDRSKADMAEKLLGVLGEAGAHRFWEIYEEVRQQVDVVSYPDTLARFVEEWPDKTAARRAANIVNEWPYEDYLYPGTVASLEHVCKLGEVAILSDGDAVYQPQKIARAGLAQIVGYDDVLIFTHKQDHLEDIMKRLPARHYVLADDKETILARVKKAVGGKITTVWVKQGHYAHDPKQYRKPDPDIVLDRIDGLCKLGKSEFMR